MEEAFVKNFVRADKRDRWSGMLGSSKRRAKARHRMSHTLMADLDARHATTIDTDDVDVEAELRRRGAPDRCWVVAENSTIDGQDHALAIVIENLWSGCGGPGIVIMCTPTLGYFQDEDGVRAILERVTR